MAIALIIGRDCPDQAALSGLYSEGEYYFLLCESDEGLRAEISMCAMKKEHPKAEHPHVVGFQNDRIPRIYLGDLEALVAHEGLAFDASILRFKPESPEGCSSPGM